MTKRLNLADLKAQSPKDLLSLAEELDIENASTMRKGDMMFAILRERADEEWVIGGDGVLEVVQDGFGFLRSPEANYLAGPDDIYVSPNQIRKFALRTGDTVEGGGVDHWKIQLLVSGTQLVKQVKYLIHHPIRTSPRTVYLVNHNNRVQTLLKSLGCNKTGLRHRTINRIN